VALPYLAKNGHDVENADEIAELRSFSNHFSPRDMLKIPKSLQDHHHDLASVRGFIGENYLPSAKTLQQKQLLLEIVYISCIQELNSRFRRGKINTLPVDQVNASLIKRIKENFLAI
jgi:hypothetical protein